MQLADAPMSERTVVCPVPGCGAEFALNKRRERAEHMSMDAVHLSRLIELLRQNGLFAEAAKVLQERD